MQALDMGDGENIPAVSQMGSHILQVVVPHVVDAEDVEVGVLRDAFLDVGIKAERQLFAFLLGLGGVHNFGAL